VSEQERPIPQKGGIVPAGTALQLVVIALMLVTLVITF